MSFYSKQFCMCVIFTIVWHLPAVSGACSCYTFHGDLRPWYPSRQHCLKNGGDLVSMETENEWSLINDEIQRRSTVKLGSNEWHIGLTNLTGTWRWMNNVSLTFDRWQEGEPEHVLYKRFVTMAKNWPIGKHGLFNSLRGDIPRARICEYKRDCRDLEAVCRAIAARFAITTSTPSPQATASTKMLYTKESPHNIDPVYEGPNPTSPYSSNASNDRKPHYVIIIVIVVGALIVGCCCILIIACGWRRRKSAAKERSKEIDANRTSHLPIKVQNKSGSYNPNGLIESGDVIHIEKETAQPLLEDNVLRINDCLTECQPTYELSCRDHEYAEIRETIEPSNGHKPFNENRVRFADEQCPHKEYQRATITEPQHAVPTSNRTNHLDSNSNGVDGSPEAIYATIADYTKSQTETQIGGNDGKETTAQLTEDSNELNIVKLEVVVPTQEAQFASIVAVKTHPQQHKRILKKNKTPFLKTFAPVSNGENEYNRDVDARDKILNTEYRPHEVIYAQVDQNKKINKKTIPPVEMNYVELAAFDDNAFRYTKRPSPYNRTKYAVVEIPADYGDPEN